MIFAIILLMETVVLNVPDEILTIRPIAELLKIKEKTAYKLSSEGKTPAFKVGGSWRFRRSDLDRAIDQQRIAAKAREG